MMPPPPGPASAGDTAGHPDLAVPRILGDFEALTSDLPESRGALWKLAEPGRQLDANLVHLLPGQHVGTHAEPDLDVLLLVVAGDGILGTTGHALPLAKGTIVWLPRGSSRSGRRRGVLPDRAPAPSRHADQVASGGRGRGPEVSQRRKAGTQASEVSQRLRPAR